MAITLSSCLARSRSVCRSSDLFATASDSFAADCTEFAAVSTKEELSLQFPEEGAIQQEAHNHYVNPLYSKEDVLSMCAKVRCSARYEWQGVRNYMLLVIGICTGLRVSDLVRMRLGDIVSTDGTFRVSSEVLMKKTHGVVSINFNKVCYQAVLDWLCSIGKDPAHLCAADLNMWLANKDKAGSKAVAEDRLYRVIKKAAVDAGIPYNVGSHTMRKTFSRIWYENNKSNPNAIYVLQKMLGHKSIESTLHYISVAKEESRKFAGTLEEVFAAEVPVDTTASATANTTVSTNNVSTNNASTTNVVADEIPTNKVCASNSNCPAATAIGLADNDTAPNSMLATNGTVRKRILTASNSFMPTINRNATKVTDFIKLTRNNNTSLFPIGYSDHKSMIEPLTMSAHKLG